MESVCWAGRRAGRADRREEDTEALVSSAGHLLGLGLVELGALPGGSPLLCEVLGGDALLLLDKQGALGVVGGTGRGGRVSSSADNRGIV